MRRALVLLLASGWLGCAAAAPAAVTPEERLKDVFLAIEANQPDLAMKRVEALIAEHPNFRLAHLVRGDLLLSRARPLETFGNVVKTVPQEKVDGLREEAFARMRALRRRPAEDMVPRVVLQLSSEQKHVLVVDSQNSRLYLFANEGGQPHLMSDYYVTLGKNGVDKAREGDQKTPLGVYYVTANLPRSKLTDFYGPAAFPISYPNEWDRRRGRNGYGIWLHGVPSDLYSRPPRASDGCLVLSNPDLETVGRQVQVGTTPVIIADKIEWTSAGAVEAERAALAAAVEEWRADWQSRDTERYLRHYSPRFSTGSQDLAAWSTHKRTVNAAKSWIQVRLSGMSMFRYPLENDFAVVSFVQDYRSNGLANVMKKRQYWIKEDGRWKILYEGAA